MTKVSIIIPCRNEKAYLEDMLSSMTATAGGDIGEVIVVDDGSTDGSCDFLQQKPTYPWPVELITTSGQGPAKARNMGARQAKGQILLFCDAHLIFNHDQWLKEMLKGFTTDKTGAVCPGIGATADHQAVGYGSYLDSNLHFGWLPKPQELEPVPIGPGGCLAVTRSAFLATGGFEENFPTWGYEDVEISLRLWLFGYQILVQPSTLVLHEFRRHHPYPVKYQDTDYNLLWLAICHFNQRRLLKVVDQVNARKNFSANLSQLLQSPVWQTSQAYRHQRQFDDDWFFAKFNINF